MELPTKRDAVGRNSLIEIYIYRFIYHHMVYWQATDQLYAWKSKKRNLENKEAMWNLHLHSEATQGTFQPYSRKKGRGGQHNNWHN